MMDILKEYNVSRETLEKLQTFQNLVLEWNTRFNLISKSSEKDIWNRHIVDSLQLCQFLNDKDKILYDFGSGAGFPGIVLAVFAKEKYPNLKICLIESIGKKTTFLSEAKKVLKLNNTNIINERIENIKSSSADIISSRALASLDKIFQYASPFCSKKTRLILPKGEKWKEEVLMAQKRWIFEIKTIPSITSKQGCILYIENLRRKQNG